jgi:hypothetical protein
MSLVSANLDSSLLDCWIYLCWKRVVDADIACSLRMSEKVGSLGLCQTDLETQ